jgi:hypothetical protein
MTHPVFGSMAALEQSFGKLGHPLTDFGLLLVEDEVLFAA